MLLVFDKLINLQSGMQHTYLLNISYKMVFRFFKFNYLGLLRILTLLSYRLTIVTKYNKKNNIGTNQNLAVFREQFVSRTFDDHCTRKFSLFLAILDASRVLNPLLYFSILQNYHCVLFFKLKLVFCCANILCYHFVELFNKDIGDYLAVRNLDP